MSDNSNEERKRSWNSRYSNIPVEELIKMIEERPVIWNKYHADYKSKATKELAWEEVFLKIDPSYPEMALKAKNDFRLLITNKWTNLRDSYIKSKKMVRVRKKNKPYVYAKHMHFLDLLTKVKKTGAKKYYVKNEEESDSCDDNDEYYQKLMHEVYVDEGESDLSEEPQPKLVKVKTEANMSYGEPSVSCTEANMSCTEPNVSCTEQNIASIIAKIMNKDDDEDAAFFKSIMPSVKSLSDDAKLEFRIEVMKTIKELRRNDDRKKTQRHGHPCDDDDIVF